MQESGKEWAGMLSVRDEKAWEASWLFVDDRVLVTVCN